MKYKELEDNIEYLMKEWRPQKIDDGFLVLKKQLALKNLPKEVYSLSFIVKTIPNSTVWEADRIFSPVFSYKIDAQPNFGGLNSIDSVEKSFFCAHQTDEIGIMENLANATEGGTNKEKPVCILNTHKGREKLMKNMLGNQYQDFIFKCENLILHKDLSNNLKDNISKIKSRKI